MKLCVDLACGLKGFSQAFQEDPEWEVIGVDIEKKFTPEILSDVRYLKLEDIISSLNLPLPEYEKKIVLASPPCTYFSKAAGLGIMRKGTSEALNILAGCVRIIEELKHDGFIIENPANGYLAFFIGKPNFRVRLNGWGYVTVKPTAFWGNISLPFGIAKDSPKANGKKNAWENFASRTPSKRAKLPYEFSKAIKEVVD